MTGTSPQMLRSDARENRDRVVEAARELFARTGLNVTMREIARHADVGPATLYRRFPTKSALVLEAFLQELDACSRIVREATEDSDAWRSFSGLITGVIALNAQNRGFTEAFLSEFPDAIDFAAHRSEMLRAVAAIGHRAQQAGRLRPDFVLDDFIVILHAGRALASVAHEERSAAAHRFAALALEGLRASASNRRLPGPPRLVRRGDPRDATSPGAA